MAGKNTSERVALGGIVAALCIVLMFLTGVIPALYIAAPMCAGMLMIILVEEVSVAWGWLTYVATSLLALMVTFGKEAALMFILFFGYYPILRRYISKIRYRALQQVLKLLLFNLFLVVDYALTVYVLGLPSFDDYSKAMLIGLAVAANLMFLFYDRLLAQMGQFYRKVFVKRVLRKNS